MCIFRRPLLRLQPARYQWVVGMFVIVLCSHTIANEMTEEQRLKFEQVKRNIEALKRDLEKTKSAQSELQDVLEKNERSIQELNQKTEKLRSNIEEKQSRLKRLDTRQDKLSAEKTEQSVLVADYLNSAYRLGKQNELKLLFNQQDPAQVSRMLKYFQAFSESRQEKIALFVETLKQLESVEADIAFEKQQLQNSFAKLQTEKRALQDKQQDRMQTLGKLEASLSDKNSRLAGLERDRKRLEAVLSKVYEEIHAQELSVGISEFAQLKGKLPKPTNGTARNTFGKRRAESRLTWQGIEFQGKLGSDVIAVHHGQVVFADYLRGHGLLIIVDHGAGFMTLYAHASNLYKELGEWVEAGEVIASLGNTGGRRDPALYFELRHNGKPTNPSLWFKRA